MKIKNEKRAVNNLMSVNLKRDKIGQLHRKM